MTIKQARKLLGKDAKNITDKDLQEEIELAEFFKDFYFSDSRHFSSKKLADLRSVYRSEYPERVSTTMVVEEIMS